MRSAIRLATVVFLAGLLAPLLPYIGSPAFAQNAINHDTLMQGDITAAGRRALMQDALKHAHDGRNAAAASSGPEVDLHITFPRNQTGLDNINMILLVPTGAGAHQCEALAQVRGNTIFSIFIARKDVRPGHTYIVAASDARDDNYPIGRIHIGPGRQQSFNISAPLLTPNSPRLQAGQAVQPATAPTQRMTPDQAAARLEQARREMPNWAMGIAATTITPALLAAVGHPGSHLRGVVVTAVLPGSPAARAGIGRGDVILRVNGAPCADVRELASLTAGRRHGQASELFMYSRRAHGMRTVRVPVDWHFQADTQRAGPSYVPPQTQPYRPPRTEPGFVPPREGPGYVPPSVGPGFQPPGSR